MAAVVNRSMATSSISAPHSQVTAPVLEYRCMFTHDLHKKQKKWHDGNLRFHTFNKRVMVYDESRNLVGDLHYRQHEAFGEGLELQLDRPVLVQVDEQISQTCTDLTPLLARQRQDAVASSSYEPQPARAALARINPADSRLKPKSIKDLLGGSQGKLGRARLPVQSPFEQRQALAESHPNREPEAKRRKMDHYQQSPHPSKTTGSHLEARIQVALSTATSGQVVAISSDDPRPTEPRTKTAGCRDPAPAQSRQPRTQIRPINSPKSIREPSDSGFAIPADVLSQSDARNPPRLTSGPRSSLTFAPACRRNKLLCISSLVTAGADVKPSRLQREGQSAARKRRKKASELLEMENDFAASQIAREVAAAVTDNGQEHENDHAAEVDGPLVELVPDKENEPNRCASVPDIPVSPGLPASPPFISQASFTTQPALVLNHDPHAESGLSQSMQLDLTGLSPSLSRTAASTPASPQPGPEADSALVLSQSPFVDLPDATFEQSQTRPPQDLTELSVADGVSAGPLGDEFHHRQTTLRGKQWPFRRVVSEIAPNLPPLTDEFMGADDDSDVLGPPAITSSRRSPRRAGTIVAGRDFASDPVEAPRPVASSCQPLPPPSPELHEESAAAIVQIQEEPVPQHDLDSGPWSTDEAFLLFDWWPSGKQKPDYGQSTRSSVGDLAARRTGANVTAVNKKYGTFGSARLVSQR